MMSYRTYILIFLLFTFTFLAIGQPGDPGGDPDAGEQPVPIQGAIYLLIAGALLGFKKIRNMLRKQ